MASRNFLKYPFFALINFLLLIRGKTSLPNQTDDVVTTCIEKIVEKYLSPEDLIVQTNLHLHFNFPIVKYDPRKHFYKFNIRRPDAYIIFVESDLNVLESMFMDIIHFNPRAKFIFVCTKIVYEFLSMMSRFYIYHVVVLELNEPSLIYLYRYNPSRDNSLKIIGNCSESGSFEKNDLFQYKPNRKKINLTILYVEYPPYVIDMNSTQNPGIEISLMNLITSHLNANVTYIKSNFDYWGEVENEDFTNTWGELKSRQFDFAIGWFHIKFNEFLYFDMSVAYLNDAVTFVAPKAKLYPDNIYSLIRAFQTQLWIIYFITLLIFLAIFYLIKKYSDNYFNILKIMDNVLFLIQLVIETGVKFNPNHRLIHFFLTLCIFFIFSMNAAFKSKLLLLFSQKKFEYQINTMEDIINSGIGIGYHPYFNNSFDNYEPHTKKKIYDKSIPCEFGWACTNRTANQRDMVAVQTEGQFKYFAPRDYVDQEGKALLHLTDVVVRPFPGHAFFVKGFPLFKKINRCLMILIENGFVRYHYAKIELENEISLYKATYKHKRLLKKSLDLAKLVGVFYLYLAGTFLGCLVFVIEIFTFYFKSQTIIEQ